MTISNEILILLANFWTLYSSCIPENHIGFFIVLEMLSKLIICVKDTLPVPVSNNFLFVDPIRKFAGPIFPLFPVGFYLTALELHGELAECGRSLPLLHQFFSSPSNLMLGGEDAAPSPSIRRDTPVRNLAPSAASFPHDIRDARFRFCDIVCLTIIRLPLPRPSTCSVMSCFICKYRYRVVLKLFTSKCNGSLFSSFI
jgi:hypothetical protein